MPAAVFGVPLKVNGRELQRRNWARPIDAAGSPNMPNMSCNVPTSQALAPSASVPAFIADNLRFLAQNGLGVADIFAHPSRSNDVSCLKHLLDGGVQLSDVLATVQPQEAATYLVSLDATRPTLPRLRPCKLFPPPSTRC
jgi:hypothetical protein